MDQERHAARRAGRPAGPIDARLDHGPIAVRDLAAAVVLFHDLLGVAVLHVRR